MLSDMVNKDYDIYLIRIACIKLMKKGVAPCYKGTSTPFNSDSYLSNAKIVVAKYRDELARGFLK